MNDENIEDLAVDIYVGLDNIDNKKYQMDNY